MAEEEKGKARGASLEELGQKVDALEGYMRDYRDAKRINKTVKIVAVVAIVAVVLFYVAMFGRDMYRVYGAAKRITGDPAFQQEMAEALQDGLVLMRPRLERDLKDSLERVKPKLEEELKTAVEKFRPEIQQAFEQELKALRDQVGTQLEGQLRSAVEDVLNQVVDVELAALYENLHTKILEELRRTGRRLMPVVQERLKEQADILYESLTAELSVELHKQFVPLLEYYLKELELEFPEITEDKVATMAANLQVAFEEAMRDIIEERFKDHKEVLVDIADTMEEFEAAEEATDEELWREVKENILDLLQIKLATEMIKTEE